MDHRIWLAQLRTFTEGIQKIPGDVHCSLQIDPPLSPAKLAELASKWPAGVPESLANLWTHGSAKVTCKYVWEPTPEELPMLRTVFEDAYSIYGGPRFEPPDDIYPGNSGADPNDKFILETLGRRDLDLWCRCAIFMHIENGDCLGLDVVENPADPPVVYLVHDEPGSCFLAPSLDRFLEVWAELAYIGPEIWLLHYWIDEEKGLLDPTRHKTDELRRLLCRAGQMGPPLSGGP